MRLSSAAFVFLVVVDPFCYAVRALFMHLHVSLFVMLWKTLRILQNADLMNAMAQKVPLDDGGFNCDAMDQEAWEELSRALRAKPEH